MKTDYPELEGKEVKYVWSNGKVHYGKVSGCNYHVGITIQNEKDYLICFTGKHSPRYKEIQNPMKRFIYRKTFHYLIKEIQKGIIYVSNVQRFFREYDSNPGESPSAENCPYV